MHVPGMLAAGRCVGDGREGGRLLRISLEGSHPARPPHLQHPSHGRRGGENRVPADPDGLGAGVDLNGLAPAARGADDAGRGQDGGGEWRLHVSSRTGCGSLRVSHPGRAPAVTSRTCLAPVRS